VPGPGPNFETVSSLWCTSIALICVRVRERGDVRLAVLIDGIARLSSPGSRGWRAPRAAATYEHIYMHPEQGHLKGALLPKPGPVLQVSGDLPIDLSRYNRPVTDTRTQRRR
jgi:hypothetical protein